jgi:hypothetical protein
VYGHRSEKRTIPISGSLALRWPASDRNIPADVRARRMLAAIAATAAAHFTSAGLLGANPTFPFPQRLRNGIPHNTAVL